MNIGNFVKRIGSGTLLGLSLWLSLMYAPPAVFSCLLLLILITILCTEWRNFFNPRLLPFWVIMPLYPILPFILLLYLNHVTIYHDLLLILFVIVSSHDTGGYLVGSFLGTHKMAPRISPGKTWEGFWGGYLAACISFSLLLYELSIIKSWSFIAIFTLLVCTLACIGDLFESWLKRRVGIKDSGSSLPGHGGFLDRFDGILSAAFFFYFFRDTLVQVFFTS